MSTRAFTIALFWIGICSVPFASVERRVPGTSFADHAGAAVAPQDPDGIRALLTRVEESVRTGRPDTYLGLLADRADRSRAALFAAGEIRGGITRVTLLERDREAIAAQTWTGLRVVADAFVTSGDRGRVATWQFDLVQSSSGWAIADQERLSSVDNLYRLVLNPTRQFAARDFTIQAEDFNLTLERGSVFTVDTDQGVTALVLLGRGTMRFHPTPEIERRQVALFVGSEAVSSRFEAAYIRVGHLESHANMAALSPRPLSAEMFQQADLVFREESAKSFALDLSDFTSESWTLLPATSDILAEVRTPRFGTLTYSRSAALPEDISFFDRARVKNISVYTSAAKLATRGPFFNEDEMAEFDVRNYDIDVAYDPQRHTVDGRVRLQLTTGAIATSQLRLYLAPSLAVQSVTSEQYGRLFSVRVRSQDTLLILLPAVLLPDTDLTVTVTYRGTLESQPTDWEMLSLEGGAQNAQFEFPARPLRLEPRDLYSSQIYWYPRPFATDYATAAIRITLPENYDCIASGERASESVLLDATSGPRQKRLVFNVAQPLRYLSFFVTRLSLIDRTSVTFDGGSAIKLDVFAHDTLVEKAAGLSARAADILRYYQSMAGDAPFPSLTLALIGGLLPGGHSPGYFSLISEPPPNRPRFWKNDPAAFDTYPEFFPAHEIAHQWWGQAVGWNTYHNQWLSEGFAQYFATLYVGHERGDEAFLAILANMRDWALRESDQGPVFLGYRLGHVRGDSQVFRALVYDKGAMVLHMLRRLVGDDAFYRGLREFYGTSRYRKASTEDLRKSMETASGRSLQRFFDRWIYADTLPRLRFSYRVEGSGGDREVVLRVDQTGEIFDVPVTVLLQYRDRPAFEVTIAASDRSTEMRVPLAGTLRRVTVVPEHTLAAIR